MKTTKRKLTKEQRRIAIINDAIQQLKIGAYRTGEYGYLRLSQSIKDAISDNPEKSAKTVLCKIDNKKEYCEVCFKSGLFLSTIRKENKFAVGDLNSDHEVIIKKLTQGSLFNKKNLFLAEACYERYEGWANVYKTPGCVWRLYVSDFSYPISLVGSDFSPSEVEALLPKMKEFVSKYPNGCNNERNERLLAILKNMKRNKGRFVL